MRSGKDLNIYRNVKEMLLRLLPRPFLFRVEPALRSLFALFYTGRRYQCNICGKQLRAFINLYNGDRLCPKCGSIARNRRLWQILRSGSLKAGMTVLDFSPSRCLYRRLKQENIITYISTDISGDFLADRQYDITAIDAPEAAFDLVLCYHVLEHVEADRQAMRELYRVLAPGGLCLMQTPFKAGNIYENERIKSAKDRLYHFGQEDHVRIYSAEGLKGRLESCGFQVEVRTYTAEEHDQHGFALRETVLFGRK